MADSYSKWVMTTAFANNLQASINSGNKIEWVSIKTSDDAHVFADLAGFNDTTLATASIKQTATINTVSIAGNTVTITALFNNQDNQADYYIKTLFLVAKYNGTEFLAGATVANSAGTAFRMPAASATEITEFTARPQITVSNSSTISATVDPVVAATNERVDSLETTLQGEISDINTDKQSLWDTLVNYVTKAGTETITGIKTFTQTIVGSITGNAGTATKLQNPRTVQTKLDSTSATNFDGTANITPGVSGVLSTGNGGTGRTDGQAIGLVTRLATFTDFATVAANMTTYAGRWYVGNTSIANAPTSGLVYYVVNVVIGNNNLAGYIEVIDYGLANVTRYQTSVDSGSIVGWNKLLDTTNPVPIANGGTGANTRLEAIDKLSNLGTNPISSLANDTVVNWLGLGSGYFYIGNTGLLNNQPSQYLVGYQITTASDLVQYVSVQPGGATYYRKGNRNGWWGSSTDTGTWKQLADSSNIPVSNGSVSTNILQVDANIAGQSNDNMVAGLQTGGTMVVGGGESARAFLTAMANNAVPIGSPNAGNEQMILVSDSAVYIGAGYQNGGTTGKWWAFNKTGDIVAPSGNKLQEANDGSIKVYGLGTYFTTDTYLTLTFSGKVVSVQGELKTAVDMSGGASLGENIIPSGYRPVAIRTKQVGFNSNAAGTKVYADVYFNPSGVISIDNMVVGSNMNAYGTIPAGSALNISDTWVIA